LEHRPLEPIALGELHAKGVGLYVHQQGLDTTTPAGRTMFQVMGVFAEFERAMLIDRVKAGLARARAAGKRLGRPRLPQEVIDRIRRELEVGRGIHATAKRLGVGVGSVQRVKAELRASLPNRMIAAHQGGAPSVVGAPQ
jgi:DNA invertase Pin-like site-specific DNA recombinase